MCKKFASIFLAFALLLGLVGCQSEQDKKFDELTKSSSSVPEPESQAEALGEASGEVTLLTTYGGNWTCAYILANEFNKTHPGLKVTVEGGIKDFENSTDADYDNFQKQLATELMSGDASYMLNDDGILDPTKFTESGLFYDIGKWIEEDEDIVLSDYYQNILDTAKHNGGLYSIPLLSYVNSVYLNKPILDALEISYEPFDTIDYKTILDIYSQAREKGLIDEGTPLEYLDGLGAYYLFRDSDIADYVDLEMRTASFDSPEFIQFLEETKNGICTQTKSAEGARALGHLEEFGTEALNGDQSLVFMSAAYLSRGLSAEGCVGPLVLASGQGNVVMSPSFTMSVPVSCENPALAWEFIKFCLMPVENPEQYSQQYETEGVDITVYGYFPLNKKNMRTYAELYGVTDEALLEKCETALDKVNVSRTNLYSLLSIIQSDLIEYYDSTSISAETCAKKVQGKAEINMNE